MPDTAKPNAPDVTGDLLGLVDGAYRLEVADGEARCTRLERPGDDVRTVSSRGLSLLYAGAQSSANLRAAGHLTGGDRIIQHQS